LPGRLRRLSISQHAPAATTYQLSVAPAPAAGPIAADLAILTPHVRSGLDNDRIAVLYPTGAWTISPPRAGAVRSMRCCWS
jgi:hypothetical protein